ncbi:Bardet-Biedl syndrome 2 protein homolog isoform X1 [Neodiprion lecontei]|uniref:Bardet-Biedl syndrome 2 protein homolog n=1 Tax=Neodiprion lecontei TaxID=441921 RepID=A0A6J0BFQ2_NEOLC|nr:Bardet-Biedl syndrome 2 protein homolog isoform X1 [Neodiprion lecontei]
MAAFSLQLERKVESGLVACGKFDGSHACIVVATSGGNILVHSPHRRPLPNPDDDPKTGRLAWTGELAELRIGKQVTSLYAGRLGEDERDVLMIGTATHLLVYNVEDNADVFYKEMSDGAYTVTVGKLGWLTDRSVVVIGGNCSVTVLDASGTEVFWTVTGDVVVSLMIFDFDGDGANELILGSVDFEIRALKGDSVAWDVKETAPVTALVALSGCQFGYAVGNGTVGVYEMGQRLWRVKSKHRVVAIRGYDVNGDGTEELVTGWSSGKVDARVPATGEVVFRVQLSAAVVGIARADYRRTGRPDLVVVSATGEVRGFGPGAASSEASEPGDKMRELLAKKQALIAEMRHRAANPGSFASRLAVEVSCGDGAVRMALAAGPGLLVHCAIVFAEGVFDGETLVDRPSRPCGQIEIELRPPKDTPVDVHVKVCVGPMGADLLQVFELTRQLPRFCMYERIEKPIDVEDALLDESGVTIEVAERPQRVAIWLGQNLILPEETEVEVAEVGPTAGTLNVCLRGLRDGKLHRLEATSGGKIRLRTNDSNFAGEVVQSLASYLGLGELGAEANFPEDEKLMTEALERLTGLRETEIRLRAGEARGAAMLRNLLVRTEDARILGDAKNAKTRLAQLRAVNGDLIRDHEIGANSYRDLVRTLKELNAAVQRIARLRVGKASANAIAKCRSAIRDGDTRALVAVARQG